MGINLFPARVPIGRVVDSTGKERDVLMTVEFSRALADVLQRIGGSNGIGNDDLELLSSFGDTDAQMTAMRAEIQALRSELAIFQPYAALAQQIDELRAMIGMAEDPAAAVRYLAKTAAVPSNALPLINGVAAAGTGAPYSRQDHVHPTDTTRQATIVPGTATGSRAGNAALASLLTALAASGLVINSTTA